MKNEEIKELRELREENKKLKEKLEKKDKKLQHYEKSLADNTVIERWRIGKYLHDNLAQQLTSAKFSLQLLKNKLSKENLTTTCNDIVNIIDESIQEVRELSHDIIPLDVEKEGVEQALNHLRKQAEKQHNITCRLETDEILQKINSRKVATNLYHIAQEAIKNAVTHGDAKNIKIALIEHEQQLYLHVKDDGKGLDPASDNGGMGVTIMQHRAEELGGECRIKDAKSDDYTTCVTCTLPLQALAGE